MIFCDADKCEHQRTTPNSVIQANGLLEDAGRCILTSIHINGYGKCEQFKNKHVKDLKKLSLFMEEK